jgi:hypothetical protein
MVKKHEEEQRKKAGSEQKQVAATTVKEPEAPKPGLTSTERNELKKLEREIMQGEARKKEIMERFNAENISPDEIAKLSTELGTLQTAMELKEMRWLELSV